MLDSPKKVYRVHLRIRVHAKGEKSLQNMITRLLKQYLGVETIEADVIEEKSP